MTEDEYPPELIARAREYAAGGDVQNQFNLGRVLKRFPEKGAPGEFAHWLALAGCNGIGEAYWELGMAYIDADIVEQDFRRSFEWLSKGAKLDDPNCLYNLGVQYLNGAGVEKSLDLAFSCFKRGADLGDTNSQYNLAIFYMDGMATARDLQASSRWANKVFAVDENRGGALLQRLAGIFEREGGSLSIELNSSQSRDLMRAIAQGQLDAHMQERRDAAAQVASKAPPPPSPVPSVTPLQRLQAAAEKGYAVAQIELAKTLRDKGDHEVASDWFIKAARSGSAEAQYQIGLNFLKGLGVAVDLFRARSWLQPAAQQGHAVAARALAEIAPELARREADTLQLRQAANVGDAEAQFQLAGRYAAGLMCPMDKAAAVAYYGVAATNGHALAQLQMFKCCENGFGMEKDSAQGVRWLIQAASRGEPEALWHLARRYADRRIGKRDHPDVAALFAKAETMYPDYCDPDVPPPGIEKLFAAANGGDLAAIYRLAIRLFDGLGVEKSEPKGLYYLKMAAERNYLPAQVQLARFYAAGHAVERDMERARSMFVAAARQGHFEARMDLIQGFGLTQNEVEQLLK